MNEIIIAALLWLGTHLGLSSSSLRPRLVNVVGAQGFLGIYSLVALATLAYLIWVYGVVPRETYLWLPNPDLFWIAKITMPIACVLLVGGFMVRNPTMVGMTLDEMSDDEVKNLATGVTRITRHPFQWAVVLWGLSHMAVNGDLVSWVFFLSFVLLSFLGTMAMDKKKALTLGEGWQAYAGVTSNLPFGAIASGRNRLAIKELILPAIVGLVTYGLMYWGHEFITGTVVI